MRAQYFFIAGQKVVHERKLFTWFNLIAQIGGLSATFYSLINIVGFHVIYWFIYGKVIQDLFYIYKEESTDREHDDDDCLHQKAKFSTQDHMWNANWAKPFLYILNCGKRSKSSRIFAYLYERLISELTITDKLVQKKKLDALVLSIFENQKQ